MNKNIPYKYYKSSLLMTWALAIICIIAIWVGFCVGNNAAFVFAIISDAFLTLFLTILIVLLFISGRKDYIVRGIIYTCLTVAHLAFFVFCTVLRFKIVALSAAAYYALPISHTLLLAGISIVGIYFWIRNKFSFKSIAREDAQAAFGGPIEDSKQIPELPIEPKETKPARDEKTGIVSL